MNNVTTIILTRSLLALTLIVGGIFAIRYGFQLYLRGKGIKVDGTTVELKDLKARLQTTGAVLMLTSGFWAWLGYLTAPSMRDEHEGVTISQAQPTPQPTSSNNEPVPVPASHEGTFTYEPSPTKTCPACKGLGEQKISSGAHHKCPVCNGTGKIKPK